MLSVPRQGCIAAQYFLRTGTEVPLGGDEFAQTHQGTELHLGNRFGKWSPVVFSGKSHGIEKIRE